MITTKKMIYGFSMIVLYSILLTIAMISNSAIIKMISLGGLAFYHGIIIGYTVSK